MFSNHRRIRGGHQDDGSLSTLQYRLSEIEKDTFRFRYAHPTARILRFACKSYMAISPSFGVLRPAFGTAKKGIASGHCSFNREIFNESTLSWFRPYVFSSFRAFWLSCNLSRALLTVLAYQSEPRALPIVASFSFRAIALNVMPSARQSFIRDKTPAGIGITRNAARAFTRASCGRGFPSFTPLALAAASAALVRSEIISRSCSATAARM